jgi:hypothetical protein
VEKLEFFREALGDGGYDAQQLFSARGNGPLADGFGCVLTCAKEPSVPATR